jgi:hypothetical protein
MREEALALAAAAEDPARRLNVLREYLQAFALRSLHESEAALNLTFVGGTALRLLFGLPRFSEDLDFSLAASEGYEPVAWLGKLKRDMVRAGFGTAVSWSDRKTVHAAWIRVSGLLKEARLSPLAGQELSIKLEIDTRPPAGGIVVSTVLTRHFTFVVRHHDRSSLMAGKLHALLTRPYPKGRDWFDLLWYRSLRPPQSPNLELLQSALDQTEGAGTVDAARWQELLRARAAKIDIEGLRRDVGPFLERAEDVALLTREHIESALAG